MKEKFDIKGASILVADDNPINLMVVESMLQDFGAEVRVALDGMAAIKSALKQPPDIILLDIHMPNMDGYEACVKLKANEITRDIPVIFASAMNDEFNKVKGFEVGAVDYITKPLQLEELHSRIGVHLQLHRHHNKLMEQAEELKAFNDSMMGREMRVFELKKEVNELSGELGKIKPYPEADD